MKLSTISFLALSSQANARFLRHLQQCPIPGSGVTCPAVVVPVACGTGYKCEYDNECLANAAGFVNCLPVEDFCPAPGTGMSCPSDKKEVICNNKCTYDNTCLANAAGFAPIACAEVPPPCNPTTGANCPPTTVPPPATNPPLPPCSPTTTGPCVSTQTTQTMGRHKNPSKPSPPKAEVCPKPGTGIACTSNYAPVGCGEGYKCVYDNDCLANAAGFVNCLPVEEQCPIPGTGMACPMNIDPVKCGTHLQCVYDNACLANAAGFVGCKSVNDIPPPVQLPTTTSTHQVPSTKSSRQKQSCPIPGSGMACPENIAPVGCGEGYKCVYNNACLANAAGFVNCLPVEEQCPIPGTGVSCPSDKKEVICNKCTYDNACLANAAGFASKACVEVPPPCNPTTGANCPPTTVPPPATNPPLPPCQPHTTGDCTPNHSNLRA